MRKVTIRQPHRLISHQELFTMIYETLIWARMERSDPSVRTHRSSITSCSLISCSMQQLVTDMDVATRLISLEDDPSLPVFTIRMWFLGLGLACFASVLGQIFVRVAPAVSSMLIIDDYFYSTSDLRPYRSVNSSSRSSLTSWAAYSKKFYRVQEMFTQGCKRKILLSGGF